MKFSKHLKQWIRDLKPGDSVCDCRYEHLKIVEIKNEIQVETPWLIKQILFFPLVPFSITVELLEWWDALCHKHRWFLQICERILILEDGSNCSASYCASPVDHEWEHEYPSEEEEQ